MSHAFDLEVYGSLDGSASSWHDVEYEGNQLEIEDRTGERALARFVAVLARADSRALLVQGARVRVTDVAASEVVFAGLIENVDADPIAFSDYERSTVECVNNHAIADDRIVAASWEGERAGNIVRDVVDDYLAEEGVTYRLEGQDANPTVRLGPTVQETLANYVPASKVLRQLADKAGFVYRIDRDRVLWFHPRDDELAPFAIDGSLIDHDSLRVRRSSAKYRNRQYIKGGKATTDVQVERPLSGSGSSRSFPLSFPVAKAPEVRPVYRIFGDKPGTDGDYKSAYYGNVFEVFAPVRLGRCYMNVDTAGTYSVEVYTWTGFQDEGGSGKDQLVDSASLTFSSDQVGEDVEVELDITLTTPGKYYMEERSHVGNTKRSVSDEWYHPGDERPRTIKHIEGGSASGHDHAAAIYDTFHLEVERLDPDELGIKGLDSGPAWLWSAGDAIIGHDSQEPMLNEFEGIEVTYRGRYDFVAQASDTNEQNRLADLRGGSGLVEHADETEPVADRDGILAHAGAMLERWSSMGRTVTVQLRQPGLAAGQLVDVNLPDAGLTEAGNPVQFYVQSVVARPQPRSPLYTAELAEGYPEGSWADIFREIRDLGPSVIDNVNVGSGSIVVLSEAVQGEVIDWSEGTTASAYACPVPGTSTYPNTNLYPC